jgi:hypothetical protein
VTDTPSTEDPSSLGSDERIFTSPAGFRRFPRVRSALTGVQIHLTNAWRWVRWPLPLVVFALASLWLSWGYTGFIRPGDPLERAYYVAQSQGILFPQTLQGLWSLLDLVAGFRIGEAVFLEAWWSLFFLFVSVFVLVRVILWRLGVQSGPPILDLMVILVSIGFSLNPFFLFVYFKFGVSYIALMNVFLAGQVYLLSRAADKWVFWSVLLISVSCFGLAVSAYPLLIIYGPLLLFCVVFPLAIELRVPFRRWLANAAVAFGLAFLTTPALLNSLTLTLGGPPLSGGLPGYHALNLLSISYASPDGGFAGFTGVNMPAASSAYFPGAYLLIDTSLIVLACTLGLFLIHSWRRGFNATMALLAAVIGLNLPWVGSQSLAVSIETYWIGNVGPGSSGSALLFSVFDANRLTLFVFWYLVLLLLILCIAGSLRTQAATPGDRAAGYGRRRALISVLIASIAVTLAVMVLVAPVSGYPAEVTYDSNSAAYQYVASIPNPNYNQMMYFTNTSSTVSQYVFPNAMQPEGASYPFELGLLSMERSPYFGSAFQSTPAGVLILPASDRNSVALNSTVVGNYAYATNHGESNAQLGTPELVVDSIGGFLTTSSESDRTQTLLGGIQGNGSSSILYQKMPTTAFNALAMGNLVTISISLNVKHPQVGGYSIGISNSTSPFGYGVGNAFFGFGIVGIGNQTAIVSEYTFGSAWTTLAEQFIRSGSSSTSTTTIVLRNAGGNLVMYSSSSGQWYNVPTNFSVSSFKYLTVQSYLASPSSLNYNVSVYSSNYSQIVPAVPIFFDSYFGSETAFMNTLDSIRTLSIGSGFNVSDLLGAALVWAPGVSVVRPAGYAISLPGSGWFQALNTNSPQASLYGEGIPLEDLPLQFGYGPALGFANSIVPGQVLGVPLGTSAPSGTELFLNALISPAGGNLTISGPGWSRTISTFGEIPRYIWFQIEVPRASSEVHFENVDGIQSVNALLLCSNETVQATRVAIDTALLRISLLNSTTESFKGSVQGVFDPTSLESKFAIYASTGNQAVLELPSLISYSVTARSSDGSAEIVPVWGTFLGVLVTSPVEGEFNVTVAFPSFWYYDSGVLYAPLLIGMGFGLIRLRRHKLSLEGTA